ncbi:MAG: GNAT family N-acetyltransferase [Pseudomonadota bacterium]
MHIRNATAADAPALTQLAIRTFTDAFAKDNTPDDVAAFFEQNYTEAHQQREIADPGLATMVAEHDSALIAFIQVQTDAPNPDVAATPCAEVRRLYVMRDWHGRGLAPDLIEQGCDVARRNGAATLWLGVWERNARAIAFYKKHGFAVVGEKSFQLGSDLQRDLVMARSLAAA